MRWNKRMNGGARDAALAVLVFSITVCLAAPNAGKLGAALRRFAGFALPPGVLCHGAKCEPGTETTPFFPAAEDEIPADVLKLEAEFRPSGDAAGSVTERFFTSNGATDLLGNIAIKNATSLRPDFSALLAAGLSFSPSSADAPLVLVYHTHTTESYQRTDTGLYYTGGVTRAEDPAVNMVRIGDAICEALENAGIACVHDTRIYDGQYTGAYARSRAGVQEWLARYPSVRIALDVHRDSICDSDTVAVKPTVQIGGVKTAQIMILAGAEDGSVTDFPNWRQNLSFGLCLHGQAEAMFPGLMRPLYFCPRKYNLDLVPCGVLLEVGSDANTLKEAYRAARLLGRTLAALINENTE